MEMLSSFRGDKHELCVVVIKFKHVRSCPSIVCGDIYKIVMNKFARRYLLNIFRDRFHFSCISFFFIYLTILTHECVDH